MFTTKCQESVPGVLSVLFVVVVGVLTETYVKKSVMTWKGSGCGEDRVKRVGNV